ncbi:MAG: MoxR family ATPase [Acidobacteria bacterium]|nr:MoxR family ATPase [Acidobacteriota bacterium]
MAEKSARIIEQVDRVVLGQDEVKKHLLSCLFAGGHGLLEGVPGTAKTLMVLALSRLLGCTFRRIQFTPDLMPADLLGSNVFNQKTQDFEFRQGPIFTDILLADEINRTPPRTQAALLESMQERAVTLDGFRRQTSPVFTVFATQNPIEFEGTYPLPEAQRDRFLMKIGIGYPDPAAEGAMLDAYAEGRILHDREVALLEPVFEGHELLEARRLISGSINIEPGVRKYILDVVRSTRDHPSIEIAAGPRASLALLEASRARAAIEGRDFVTPDDVKAVGSPVMAHRIVLTPEAEMEGIEITDIIDTIFGQIEVPR